MTSKSLTQLIRIPKLVLELLECWSIDTATYTSLSTIFLPFASSNLFNRGRLLRKWVASFNKILSTLVSGVNLTFQVDKVSDWHRQCRYSQFWSVLLHTRPPDSVSEHSISGERIFDINLINVLFMQMEPMYICSVAYIYFWRVLGGPICSQNVFVGHFGRLPT